jgi:tetratricopeptide (TPR) repeat protein
MQLDLFRDAPRDYFEAEQRLGRLEFEACRQALERHRRRYPDTLDANGLGRAARWLETRLPGSAAGPSTAGRQLVSLARDLREGRGPEPLRPASEVVNAAVRALAELGLRAARHGGIPFDAPLDEELPWAVFLLFGGRLRQAAEALGKALSGASFGAAAWLAFGDALWGLGRKEPGLRAYREAFARKPEASHWPIASEPLLVARRRLEASWEGGWWAVGAYVEGFWPPFGQEEAAQLRLRWAEFLRLRALWLQGSACGPRLFFAGLPLSENGVSLLAHPEMDLEQVRTTLAELHEDAWELHWEQLRSR